MIEGEVRDSFRVQYLPFLLARDKQKFVIVENLKDKTSSLVLFKRNPTCTYILSITDILRIGK
jgi:hypothetical protein